jgi:hypothetical protein
MIERIAGVRERRLWADVKTCSSLVQEVLKGRQERHPEQQTVKKTVRAIDAKKWASQEFNILVRETTTHPLRSCSCPSFDSGTEHPPLDLRLVTIELMIK